VRYTPLGLLVATALLAIPSTRAPPPPILDEAAPPLSPPVTPPSSIDELRKRVAEILEREDVPGVAIALVGRDGPIWIGGVGVADETTRVPVDANTVFRVASITKSFVGLGVMKLVEQGKLDLDRPLNQLLPGAVDNRWEDVAPVTLGHVLEHTAGLDDMHFNEVFTADDAMEPAVALAINPRSRVVRWRPGTRPSYSNVGYSLAGRAIELATGERFDVWLKREVLAPLGMRDADFRRTDALAAHLATGYVDRHRASPFNPIAHRPAGALLASATDLAKLVQALLGGGAPIVSPAGLARIEHAATLPFPHTDIEYGLGNYGDVSHPVKGRGHDGGLPGFLSELRYFPELGKGYAILFNATHSLRAYVEVRRLVFAYLAQGRAVPTEPAVAADLGADFFAFANPRHALLGFLERALVGWRVAADVGGARLDPLLGDPIDIIATRDGGYKLRGESGTSIRFTPDRDGAPVMIAHFAYAEAAAWWPARVRATLVLVAVMLLQLAPIWAAVMLVVAILKRGRVAALELALWPAIAGLCMLGFPRLVREAALAEVLGEVTPITIAICATTILFATASIAGLAAAIRWSLRPDRPSLGWRVVPTLAAVAAVGLTLWLGANGIIGLRTWAW
jgi:CubicO group peptidase (beta-lactamase class C family)